MTTQRTYSCNLCRSSIEAIGSQVKGQGLGLYFKAQGGITPKYLSEVEHHICALCLFALQGMKAPE